MIDGAGELPVELKLAPSECMLPDDGLRGDFGSDDVLGHMRAVYEEKSDEGTDAGLRGILCLCRQGCSVVWSS